MTDLVDAEKVLQDFLLDIECLEELLPWTENFNLFNVLKISRTEIRHSNMLAWLMDPNENHGIGDAFLKGVLQKLIEKDSAKKYDVFQIILSDMYSFSVYREWKNIDILLVSTKERILIAIENKVGSHEHSNQLDRYRKILETDFKDYNKICVFLTPNGEEPSDLCNWDIFTYTDVVELLESISKPRELNPGVSLIIQNYIDIVRRYIVEDRQLIDICNKIYNKHKKALDLIFEYRIDSKTQIADALEEVLFRLNDEGSIIYKSEKHLSFRTNEMDDKLPLLEKPNSSWGTQSCYYYWLKLRNGKFYGIFELGGFNVPNAEMETLQKIISILKPDDKRTEGFKYKRVFRTKWYDLNDVDDLEVKAEDAVRSVVAEIKYIEKMVLDKLNEA